MDPDRRERIRRLARAVQVHIAHRAGETAGDDQRVLRENEALRDLLEPMLRADRVPQPGAPPGLEAIGDFRILSELGRGGMGVVYEAVQESLGRRVALKVLPSHGLLGERALWRFQREARLASQLDHPNIVKVFEVGGTDELHWYAMELIEGASLSVVLDEARGSGIEAATEATVLRAVAAALDDDPAPRSETVRGVGELPQRSYVETVVGIVLQVADALQHAHSKGVVHRDVKPANVLLKPDGTAVLTDFGIARQEGLPSMTITGEFAGTPYYVSPEQALGKPRDIDHRSDVYSLGATLYELVTLKKPFDGETTQEILTRILRQEPQDPSSRNPRLSPELSAIVLKSLEKVPERRYQSAGEFAADLRAFLEYRPVTARRPTSWTRFRKWVHREPLKAALAATVAAAAVALLALSLFFTGRLIREGERAQKALADFNLLANGVRLAEARSMIVSFYPPWPERMGHMETWLKQHAGPLTAQLPSLRTKLEELRHRREAAAAVAPEDRFLYEQMAILVRELEEFAEDPAGAVALVRELLDWASNVERLSLLEPAAAWAEAVEDIAGREAYGGLRMSPQLGLVPLGRDPESGLWEFVHLRSGEPGREIPKRDERGRLQITEQTGIVFVLVPGGTFAMGAQRDPGGPNYDSMADDDEAPVHDVTLGPYFLSKYELTQAQWRRLTRGEVPSLYRADRPQGRRPNPTLWSNPVESVSYEECSLVLGRNVLDLPTEAQWEYACRAGTDTPWYFGGERTGMGNHGNVADEAAHRVANWIPDEGIDDGYVVHAPAGTYEPNRFGFHDMHGNVYEWCRDVYEPGYSIPHRPGDGLRIAPPGRDDYRIVRGGSFMWHSESTRSSERFIKPPNFRSEELGVRPARRLLP